MSEHLVARNNLFNFQPAGQRKLSRRFLLRYQMQSDLKDLQHLAAYADLGLQLQRCDFMDEEVTKLTLNSCGDKISAELASDEHLRAWLLPLRQMISNGEPTNFRRIHKILERHSPHELALQHASQVKAMIEKEMSQWFPQHDPPFPDQPEKLIRHFFNGEYFHDKSTQKSKPHRDAIKVWYDSVGFEKTHWEFQVKVRNVGVALMQHAYNAVSAARYLLDKNVLTEALPISIECARLIGIKQERPSVTRKALYEDESTYRERFLRTLEHNFDQLKSFLEAANLIDYSSRIAPEKPLTIASILEENSIVFVESDHDETDGFIRFGSIINRNLGRLSGGWRYGPNQGYVFSEDALLLLDVALSECRAMAARPRRLTRRIHHIHKTLRLTDQWFWETREVDGEKQYVKYASADFSKLGL